MRKDLDTMNALREAVERRQQHDEGAAQARREIDRLILEVLQQDHEIDREELASLADVSPVKVRAIAKAGGIPPLKRGGVRKRSTS